MRKLLALIVLFCSIPSVALTGPPTTGSNLAQRRPLQALYSRVFSATTNHTDNDDSGSPAIGEYDNAKCLHWWDNGTLGKLSGDCTTDAGETLNAIVPLRAFFVTEYRFISSRASAVRGGCDLRLTIDAGVSSFGGVDFLIPDTQSTPTAAGDDFSIAVNTLIPAGSIVQAQARQGTNCETPGTPEDDCVCNSGSVAGGFAVLGHYLE